MALNARRTGRVYSALERNVSEFPTIKIWRADPRAVIPTLATAGAAGFDLHAVMPEGEDFALRPGRRALIQTGLHMAIPPGWEVQVRPRSGLAHKHGITVLNSPGTIDSDYRGPVGVILINHGDGDFPIRTGDRIAQGVLARCAAPRFEAVDNLEALEVTERGAGGFGSTGITAEGAR